MVKPFPVELAVMRCRKEIKIQFVFSCGKLVFNRWVYMLVWCNLEYSLSSFRTRRQVTISGVILRASTFSRFMQLQHSDELACMLILLGVLSSSEIFTLILTRLAMRTNIKVLSPF